MEKEVIACEASPTSSEARLICRVCEKQFSRYTCPRCNTHYCSLQCYKRHSLHCTESFMRDNVMGELQQIQPEDETKRKMLEIIKRFHSEEVEEQTMDCDEEDGSMLSEELIQKVLSGKEIKLEDFSPQQVKQFQRAVASGELSKMIEPWYPWWKQPSARTISLSPDGTQLIKPLQEHEESSVVNEIPAGAEAPIPPLSHLSSSNPSPFLAVHLVDIIYSYCFTLRLYNGDWHSDPLGAATEVLNISSVLGDDGRPESVSEALNACLEKTCSPLYKHAGGFKFGISLIDDAVCILNLGENALICMLCDLQRLVKAGERMLKSEKMDKARRRVGSGRKLRSAERKVYFLMCWVHGQPGQVWSSLACMVEVEKASILATGDASNKPGKGEGRELPEGKILIEEV